VRGERVEREGSLHRPSTAGRHAVTTRTIAIAAFVIAVIVLILLLM
jgi:hypothetical protein